MKRTFGLLFSLTAGLSLAGEGTPAQQVQSAVKKLAEASGYSWVITTKSGIDSRFVPGPVEGQTEKGGCTRWTMSFGDHKSEAFIKGEHVAVKSGDTWVKAEEMKPPPPPGPPPPGPPPAGSHPPPPPAEGTKHVSAPVSPGKGGPEGGGKFKEDRRPSFLARRLQEMKVPAAFASELAGKISTFTVSGDTFTGDLPVEAVQELLAFGQRPRSNRDRDRGERDRERDHNHGGPEPSNAKGSVTFTVNEGVLTRMELHLTATLCFKGSEVAIDRTTQFDIKDTGSAKLEIPAGAKSILEAPAP